METFKTKLADFITGHPRKILLFLTVLVVVSASFLPGLTHDPNPWLLNKAHPARVNLSELRENYTGAGDSIFILLEAPETIFNPRTLDRIQRLTKAFEDIMLFNDKDIKALTRFSKSIQGTPALILDTMLRKPGSESFWESFDSLEDALKESGQWSDKTKTFLNTIAAKRSPVSKVRSLSNTDNIIASSDGIDINPVYDAIPATPAEMETLIHNVTGNRLFKDILFTEDLKYTSIIIEQALHDSDSENQYLLYERVKHILEKEIPGPEAHYISGMPVASATLGHTIEVDSQRLFPIVLGLVVLCLFLSFRMVMGIIAPVMVVIFSLIMTLALQVVFGVPINVITTTLPVFILSIGVADGIHIFSEYRDNLLKGMTKNEAVSQTIHELTAPVIMTSLTTAIAFWTLSITEIVQLKHFGLFIAAGTLIAMVLSLVFIPSLILVLPGKPALKETKKNPTIDRYVARLLDKISGFSINKPHLVFLATFIVIALSVYGSSRVIVDNNNVKYQLDDSPLVISTDIMNSKAAGTSVLNILVRSSGKEAEPFTDPVNIKAVAAMCDFIEKKPEVGKVTGLTELIKRINYVLHEENQSFDRLPEPIERSYDGREISGSDMVAQLLLLYENGGGDILSDVVLSNYSEMNIPVILKLNSSRKIKSLIDDITAYAQTQLPPNLSIDFSGSASTMVAATSEIVTGQISSLALSFLLIFIMLIYTFRSLIIGIAAMIPLLTTISINFGIMGFFNIPLDIGTAVISSIVIGIGVDYSIHYLNRMKEYTDKGFEFDDAIFKTVQHSGKAILSNAFTVGIGFIAMLFSILTPLITMGWMITVTMFVSALSTIVLLPAVLRIVLNFRTKNVFQPKPATPAYT